MIGLDHVIEILHLPVGRLPVQLSFALQFGDRCTIARRFVGIERGRLFPVLQASQGLAQEPLRCLGAAGRRQVEIDRVAPLVDCPVQVGPLAPHLDVGFIQAPARIKATPPEPAQPLLHLRGVALDPAIDRRMVDRNAAFRQHFLKVAIADRIATIPAHRPQDHITLEMAPLEIRHRSVRPISAKHAQASRFLQQSHPDLTLEHHHPLAIQAHSVFMSRSTHDYHRRLRAVDERAAALRAESERWQALWNEAGADHVDPPIVVKPPRRRWFSFLKRTR